jgi:hypothetical protein
MIDRAARLPRTSTRIALKQRNGVQVDGVFPTNGSKASFCYAFHNSRPSVLKLYDNQLNATREVSVARQLVDEATCIAHNLVFLYTIEVSTDDVAPPI